MSYTLRIATPEDIPAIVPLVNRAFLVEDFIVGDRTSAENVLELMQTRTFLVLEEEGKIVASINVEVRGERGYFGMLAVDTERQGTGLGRRMIEEAEHFCRSNGCSMMDLKVLSPRTNLFPLYQKFGYEISGKEEFHTTRPLVGIEECYCVLMTKKL